jgi:hypothetical protein
MAQRTGDAMIAKAGGLRAVMNENATRRTAATILGAAG